MRNKILDTRELVNVLDLAQNDESQDLADTGHGSQPIEGLDVMLFGGFDDVEIQLVG
jgi:hypothetical protein